MDQDVEFTASVVAVQRLLLLRDGARLLGALAGCDERAPRAQKAALELHRALVNEAFMLVQATAAASGTPGAGTELLGAAFAAALIYKDIQAAAEDAEVGTDAEEASA
jgi:hypothetical protein